MKAWIAAAIVFAIVFLAGCSGGAQLQNGRGDVQFSVEEKGGLKEIAYASAGNVTIYGLLREVRGEKAAIVLLPGAGRTKEQEQELAEALASMGYSTFALDQRGEGESAGEAAVSLEAQYSDFAAGKEIFEQRRIYDVFRAYDVLRKLGHEKIIFAGESMGGRYALMACAVEKGCAGAVGISTSGYGLAEAKYGDEATAKFTRTIDPDAYVGEISPRKLVMIHSPGDSVIPIEAARATYLKAHEPRAFVEAACEGGTHGWCPAMNAKLEEKLAWVAG